MAWVQAKLGRPRRPLAVSAGRDSDRWARATRSTARRDRPEPPEPDTWLESSWDLPDHPPPTQAPAPFQPRRYRQPVDWATELEPPSGPDLGL